MYMLHCVSLFVKVISMCFVLFDAYCLLLTNPMLLCNHTEDNKSYHIIQHYCRKYKCCIHMSVTKWPTSGCLRKKYKSKSHNCSLHIGKID